MEMTSLGCCAYEQIGRPGRGRYTSLSIYKKKQCEVFVSHDRNLLLFEFLGSGIAACAGICPYIWKKRNTNHSAQDNVATAALRHLLSGALASVFDSV